MPELSRFFGIVIRMFVEAGAQHHRAHFHAYYQEHAAVFSVDTIECLGGSIPKAQQRLVEGLGRDSSAGIGARLGALAIWPAARQDRATKVRIMVHPIHRVTAFQIVGAYTLTVSFSDGTDQRIDFSPILHGALFGPLLDRAIFDQVALDSEAGTLVWPNGADFDPATLHDWTELRDELADRARIWAEPSMDRRP